MKLSNANNINEYDESDDDEEDGTPIASIGAANIDLSVRKQ